MKIASWNVNSIKVRLPQVLKWLKSADADVLAIQETKTLDENFPKQEIESAGYKVVFSGQKTYNGVAIISKYPASDIVTELGNFADPQRRVMFATIDKVRIMNVYVPNGSEIGSDKYKYKLKWLQYLTTDLKQNLAQYENVILLGDFNIAPADIDVYDPEVWHDRILCSEPERAELSQIMACGMTDTFREFAQEPKSFSWWDYRQAAFRRNMGLRIDLVLASKNLGLISSSIDKKPRGWERPSDHTPVLAEFKI